ncbi:MAG: hypothetical protein V3U65_03955 [Granulosicoccaceae bacterium]
MSSIKQAQSTLAATVDAFDQWRTSGESRRSTQEHLQQQAASLVGAQSKSVICRSLNIPNGTLKLWLERWAADEVNSDFIVLPTEPDVYVDDELINGDVHRLDITLPNGVALSTTVSASQLMRLIQTDSADEGSATEHRL